MELKDCRPPSLCSPVIREWLLKNVKKRVKKNLSIRKIYQVIKIKFIYSFCLDATNTSYCRSIKRSPYEVVFGIKPEVPRFLCGMQACTDEELLENGFDKELQNYKEITLILVMLEKLP